MIYQFKKYVGIIIDKLYERLPSPFVFNYTYLKDLEIDTATFYETLKWLHDEKLIRVTYGDGVKFHITAYQLTLAGINFRSEN